MTRRVDLDAPACEVRFKIVETKQLRSDGTIRILIEMTPQDIPQYSWCAETKKRDVVCNGVFERTEDFDIYQVVGRNEQKTRGKAKKSYI